MKTVIVNIDNRPESVIVENVYDDYYSGCYYFVNSVKDGIVNKHKFDIDHIVHIHVNEGEKS